VCSSDLKGIVDELDYFTNAMLQKYKTAASYNPFYFDEVGKKIQIKDLDDYLSKKTTIEDDMENFRCEPNSIMCTHTPPANLGLDVVSRLDKKGNHFKVGSKSIYKWIEKEKPLLVLSGHIHEAFRVTGKWKENIGNTVVIQPGQENKNFNKTVIVYIEIENGKVSASRIEI
jgi:Icc-related predicted phosphoesterase